MQSVELVAGRSAKLPVGYLQARLTGAVAGVRLEALGSDGVDLVEQRENDREVHLRPASRNVRLVATPVGRTFFAEHSRIGLELRTVTVNDSPQVFVSELDAGAYAHVDLAHLEFDEYQGWKVTAAGGRPADRFGFLLDRREDEAPLDEREHAWLGPGRYALRRARGGVTDVRPTGRRWTLVVDSSASMRPLFDVATLADTLALVAGVLAEATGRIPDSLGTTGLLRPEWPGVTDPRLLAVNALTSARPASWCLALPALRDAVARGAETVAVLTDGAPADLDLVLTFAREKSGVDVVLILAARPVDASWQGPPPPDLLGLGFSSHPDNLLVAGVPVLPGATLGIAESVPLAAGMTGIAP